MRWFNELRRDLSFAVGVLRARPFSVLIQVTNRCNMHCAFCTFWSKPANPDQEMVLSEFARLEEQLSEMGRFLISIEGGEPLLREDIHDIVKLFSKRHITVLYTNGWHVDKVVARRLFQNGLANVGVSIDFTEAGLHDACRGPTGAFDQAWRAVDLLREAAPFGGRQVHVITVYMDENRRDLDGLLKMSAAHRVGHTITLVSTRGSRRSAGASLPTRPVANELLALWRQHPHFRGFRDYLTLMDPFLAGSSMPTCRAGVQAFNIDHLGNVAACIERIESPAGNIRNEPLREIHARLVRSVSDLSECQDCWTLCRANGQLLGQRGTFRSWADFSTRWRSTR